VSPLTSGRTIAAAMSLQSQREGSPSRHVRTRRPCQRQLRSVDQALETGCAPSSGGVFQGVSRRRVPCRRSVDRTALSRDRTSSWHRPASGVSTASRTLLPAHEGRALCSHQAGPLHAFAAGRQRPNLRRASRPSRRSGLDGPARSACLGSHAGPPPWRLRLRATTGLSLTAPMKWFGRG